MNYSTLDYRTTGKIMQLSEQHYSARFVPYYLNTHLAYSLIRFNDIV